MLIWMQQIREPVDYSNIQYTQFLLTNFRTDVELHHNTAQICF